MVIREAAYFSLFFALAVVLNRASQYYPYPELSKLSLTFAAVAGVYLGYALLSQIATRFVQDSKTRYSMNKAIFILSLAVVIVIGIRIWVEETQSLLISYGILAAGLAIALQDLLRNFVGGIYIIIAGMYRVGDRISIGETAGDVMDVGMMNTTLMEIGRWVHGDQPTGRIVIIPNAAVISGVVHNSTKDHSFMWDEIALPLTYESDWEEAVRMVLAILVEETEELTTQAEREIERIGEKYYLPKKVVEPSIYATLTDNWILLDIRYVTDVRERRIMHDRITRRIIAAVQAAPGIAIASENLEVHGTQTILMKEDGAGEGT